jgi:hypothetical protein
MLARRIEGGPSANQAAAKLTVALPTGSSPHLPNEGGRPASPRSRRLPHQAQRRRDARPAIPPTACAPGKPPDLGDRDGPLVLPAREFDVEVEALAGEVVEAVNRSGHGTEDENRIGTM